MGEEPVPVVLAPLGVAGPVGLLGVDEDDPGVAVPVSSSLHTYQSALGLVRSWRDSWNQGCWSRGVVHDQVGDDPDAPLVGLLDQLDGVGQVAVLGQDGPEVADVVAAVAQRRLVERQQPQAVDAQPLEVVELGGDAGRSPVPSSLAS